MSTPTPALVPKVYPLLVERIEYGVAYGYGRAHKHTETPDPETVKTAICDAVLNSICEAFDIIQPTAPDDN